MQMHANLLRGHIPLAVSWARSQSTHVNLPPPPAPALAATRVTPEATPYLATPGSSRAQCLLHICSCSCQIQMGQLEVPAVTGCSSTFSCSRTILAPQCPWRRAQATLPGSSPVYPHFGPQFTSLSQGIVLFLPGQVSNRHSTCIPRLRR